MQGVEMLWDVKAAVQEQVYQVYTVRGGSKADYRECMQQVCLWRNKFREVAAELLAHAFFFYDEELGIWFNLQKVHGALRAQ